MSLDIPAPTMGTEPAALPDTTQTPEQTPPAEKPAGTDEQTATASETDKPDQLLDEEAKRTSKEKRQERNRDRWREFKAAKEFSMQRVAQLEQEVYRLKSQPPPDLSLLTDPDDVIAEKTAWRMSQKQSAETEARLQSERRVIAEQSHTAMLNKWSETVQDMTEKIPDFEDAFSKTPLHDRAAPFIVESEKGGEIAYYLAKNPKAAETLYRQFETAPAQALIELGRIEARLSAPPAKTVSTAPRPAQTLNGGMSPSGFDVASASVGDLQAQLRKSKVLR